MAFTQDQYDKLMEAIAQGALIVKYADKEVEYRNLDDMTRIKTLMEADLGINVGPGNSRVIRARYQSGLNNRSPWSKRW